MSHWNWQTAFYWFAGQMVALVMLALGFSVSGVFVGAVTSALYLAWSERRA